MKLAYTIHDPFHSSKEHILGRKAFCCGCLHNDDFLQDGTMMQKGVKVIKVTSGSARSTRTQFFHIECYVSHFNHVMDSMTNSAWKVYPTKGLVIKPSKGQTEEHLKDCIPF